LKQRGHILDSGATPDSSTKYTLDRHSPCKTGKYGGDDGVYLMGLK